MSEDNAKAPSSRAAANIAAVGKLEAEAFDARSWTERVADRISRIIGSPSFIVFQFVWLGLWAALNTGLVGHNPFDPYPFSLLGLIVSLEALLLSAFILIKQNRMSRRADERAHLALQISILTEQEATKILDLTERIARRMGVEAGDPVVAELREETKIEHLASAMKQSMPPS